MQKNFLLLLTMSSLLLSTVPALAVNPESTPKNQLQERLKIHCENVTTSIDLVINRYNNNKGRQKSAYDAVQTLITILKTKGYDTTKLEADFNQLMNLVKNFENDYSTFMSTLESSKNFICGNSEGQFLKSLQEARNLIPLLRQNTLEIRNYYQSTIRPDIQQLKKQTPVV